MGRRKGLHCLRLTGAVSSFLSGQSELSLEEAQMSGPRAERGNQGPQAAARPGKGSQEVHPGLGSCEAGQDQLCLAEGVL